MSYSLVNGQLIKDNPHLFGWFDTIAGGAKFSWGCDWEAQEAKDQLEGFSPDIGGSYGWEYNNQLEYIKRLACIAPIGTFTPADMTTAAWQTQGRWQLTSTTNFFKHRALWFYDGRPNLYPGTQWGYAKTVADTEPNVQFHIWRVGQAAGELQPSTFSIRFLGDGNQQYQLTLPAYGLTGKEHEELTGRVGDKYCKAILYGQQAGSGWSVVDTFGAGAAPELMSYTAVPKFQAVRIEYLPGTLLIRIGEGESWAVTGPWNLRNGQEVSNIELAAGPIEVRVIGHTAMFSMYEMVYPTEIKLYPWATAVTDTLINPTPSYRVIARTPAGTAITAAPTVNTCAIGVGTRPEVTFTSETGKNRACLYDVQEYRPALISAGVSNPEQTQNNSNFVLEEMSGETRQDFKGSTMTATVSAAPGSDLASIQPNSSIVALVNVHDGATHVLYDYPVTGTPYYKIMFSGYADAPSKEKPAGPKGNMRASVSARDLIDARLRKKCIDWQCSFEGNGTTAGWTVQAAFRYLLNAAGVPDALIGIDETLPPILMPGSIQPGKRKFKYQPDTDYAQALDGIVQAGWTWSTARPGQKRGLQWGVNQLGIVFLTSAYEWVAGSTADWTLDAETTTVEDMVSNLRSSRSLDDFKNYIAVMSGEGVEAAARILCDEASWSDPAAASFIGDVWKQFTSFPDGVDVDARAQEIWERVARWNWMIEWTMDDCPWLMPQQNVLVSPGYLGATPENPGINMEIPVGGAVYTIINKSWRANNAGRYSQTLQAVRVQ